jgi:hypothetical protein
MADYQVQLHFDRVHATVANRHPFLEQWTPESQSETVTSKPLGEGSRVVWSLAVDTIRPVSECEEKSFAGFALTGLAAEGYGEN